jgi:glycosyltransferase involved in cell wall biosynthesis
MMKDIFILIKNHFQLFKQYWRLKKLNPDFIYERSSYLNFNGILSACWLKILHFDEVNGLHYMEKRQYYSSLINSIVRELHQRAWASSDFNFVVGHAPKEELLNDNVTFIQNGVDQAMVHKFHPHQKTIPDRVNCIFIGHLMAHHRVELLIKAFNQLQSPGKIHLHLVGKHLASLQEQIPSAIQTTYHGVVPHDEIPALLKTMHVGLNPGGYKWSWENEVGRYAKPMFCFSPIKIFEYLAAKCLVIAPELPNLKDSFTEEELLFFRRGDVNSLQHQLDKVIEQPELIRKYGEAGHQRVKSDFTWDRIFQQVRDRIHHTIN